MPVHPVKGGGYQWGSHGKVYRGKSARAKAVAQGQAAHAAGYTSPRAGASHSQNVQTMLRREYGHGRKK